MKTIDVIIYLINIIKDKGYKKNYDISHVRANYLLNQILRQLWIPHDRYYISISVENLWNKITCQDIMKYFYQSKVTNSSGKPENTTVSRYATLHLDP